MKKMVTIFQHDPLNGKLLADTLGTMGHDAFVTQGDGMTTSIAAEQSDLLIVDWQPGSECVRRMSPNISAFIAQYGREEGIPVLVVTNDIHAGKDPALWAANPDAEILIKPFDMNFFKAKVEHMLARSAPRAVENPLRRGLTTPLAVFDF